MVDREGRPGRGPAQDPPPALPGGGTLICHADPAEFDHEDVRAQLRACLGDEERTRLARFRFQRDRLTYLVAHALTRGLLARCVPGGSPAGLRFEHSAHGRPELVCVAGGPRPRFNLSHTHGLVACGLCLDSDIGVDVEYVDRRTSIDTLASTVLSPAELTDLDGQRSQHRRPRFFEYWTLKEAYLKAVGAGLGLPLRSICFSLPGAPPVSTATVAFLPGIEDEPARFSYRCWPIGGAHQLALAVAGARNQPVVLARVDRPGLLAMLGSG